MFHTTLIFVLWFLGLLQSFAVRLQPEGICLIPWQQWDLSPEQSPQHSWQKIKISVRSQVEEHRGEETEVDKQKDTGKSSTKNLGRHPSFYSEYCEKWSYSITADNLWLLPGGRELVPMSLSCLGSRCCSGSCLWRLSKATVGIKWSYPHVDEQEPP